MTKTEIDILKNALFIAGCEEVRAYKALPDEKIVFSESFEKNIQKLAKKRKSLAWQTTKTIPRRIAVVFIAAIITFCLMMSISAIRTPIVNFFVNFYESFIDLFLGVEEPATANIEDFYSPSYIPDGYSEFTNTQSKIRIVTVWKSENGRIILTQDILNKSYKFIDNEDANYSKLQVDEKSIYYILKNGQYSLVWIDNNYLFEIDCSEEIGLNEIEKIIRSMKKNRLKSMYFARQQNFKFSSIEYTKSTHMFSLR